MPPRTKKTEKTETVAEKPVAEPVKAAPAPSTPPAKEDSKPVEPETVEQEASTENFDVVVSTLETIQKQVKALLITVKNLRKENDRLKKQVGKKTGNKEKQGPRVPSGFAKPALISDELADFLKIARGTSLSRTEVTSKVDEYVKANKLQNDKDKRIIVPDVKLSKILNIGKDEKLTYFNLQKYMKHHYVKA